MARCRHEARCDILDYTYTPTSAVECDLAWGQSLSVDFEESGFVCAGDTVFGSYPVLDYDHRTQIGKTICASEASGVTCFHNLTGSGFFLSRDAYRIF
ncbi:hypothetical protein ONR57_01440 [Hoyosella sp. YIM 151337]|uniref:DUF6636 domain-containing protein n=1 Tax=Hoyosella sp. YIM 151337 TaxID=2992742 RepID=UPI0022361C00|nr:DUF6636 domain-containing protein [Hoyosella sp. YIM 151337]MCW4351963.1 hypothetical protein [Hoyosella sp. YIM 151337]